MRKNKFFDTIMIALILMIGFRIIFPNAFPGNPDTPNTPGIDTSRMVTLPVYADFHALNADSLFAALENELCFPLAVEEDASWAFNGDNFISGPFYSTAEVLHVDSAISSNLDAVERKNFDSRGFPVFYVGDDLYYMHMQCFGAGNSTIKMTLPADVKFIIPYHAL